MFFNTTVSTPIFRITSYNVCYTKLLREKEDKELCSEITAGITYHLLLDTDNTLKQVLIPVSEDIQLHIFKKDDGTYTFQTLPIKYDEIEETLVLEINHSPYLDIIEKTNNKDLARITSYNVCYTKLLRFSFL